MPLPAPNLDDRTYATLRQMALAHIQQQLQVDWTDLTPGDPGVTLLEAFAYLTDQLIYRLNRVPDEKVYVALLRLLGVALYPPAAAGVVLAFQNFNLEEITIPALTQVTTPGSSGEENPIFMTLEEIVIPAAQSSERVTIDAATESSGADSSVVEPGRVQVKARHCTYIHRELFHSTGESGQTLTVRHLPIVAPTHDNFELLVEVAEGDHFVAWQEVKSFSHLPAASQVYLVDRMAGTIRFAPTISSSEAEKLARLPRPLAVIPPTGTIIRISYAYGGGMNGNVAANQLTAILPAPHSGVTVTNPAPAVGGEDGETLRNALTRGPQEIYSLERAITARDFERLAVQPGVGIGRAKAFTQLERWAHGTRGTVEIRLLPQLPGPQSPTASDDIAAITEARRAEGEAALEIQNLRDVLADSQAMGTAVSLHWAHLKRIWIDAEITLKERAALSAVRTRLLPKLNRLLAPLPDHDVGQHGWPFGQTLYASDIHRIVLEDEGVDAVTRLQLCVDAAPNRAVRALAADHHQPSTWYAGSGRRLFRSFNDGEGWELVTGFPAADPTAREETIRLIEANPDRAGVVAVWVHQIDGESNHRYIPFLSADCGESWHRLLSFGGRVEDMAWIARETTPIMLLATDQGLFKVELNLQGGDVDATYIPVREMQEPLHAVAVVRKNTQIYVVIARQSRGGVYLANGLFLAYDLEPEWFQADGDATGAESAGIRHMFRPLEAAQSLQAGNQSDRQQRTLRGEDIRYLAVQYEDETDPNKRVWLWAGAMSIGWEGNRRTEQEAGRGCFVWELNTPQPLRGLWLHPPGWIGGSCRGLDFVADTVLAVSQWGGVLRLNAGGTLDFLGEERATAETTDGEGAIRWQQTNSVALPRRGADVERDFEPLVAIAAAHAHDKPIAMVGGARGVYVTKNRGNNVTDASATRFDYRVTLPPDWLFLSGDHQIQADNDEGQL